MSNPNDRELLELTARLAIALAEAVKSIEYQLEPEAIPIQKSEMERLKDLVEAALQRGPSEMDKKE